MSAFYDCSSIKLPTSHRPTCHFIFFLSRRKITSTSLYICDSTKNPPYDLVFCDKTPIASHPDVKHTYIVKLGVKENAYTVTYIRNHPIDNIFL